MPSATEETLRHTTIARRAVLEYAWTHGPDVYLNDQFLTLHNDMPEDLRWNVLDIALTVWANRREREESLNSSPYRFNERGRDAELHLERFHCYQMFLRDAREAEDSSKEARSVALAATAAEFGVSVPAVRSSLTHARKILQKS
ncbi:MAG TPA: hypothetical protein VMO47_19090 [Rhodothermales bacterium]|nr:hypothetical protein [Rhodothermales bacterium]